MKIRNGYFWKDYFKNVFIPQIDIYQRCLIGKIIPSFQSIEQEAEKIEKDEFERLGNAPAFDCNGDMSNIAEKAQDKGIEYYVLMNDMKNDLIGLFCVALYHLFEQHIFMFYKKEILSPSKENNRKNMNWDELLKRFRSKGIRPELINAYSDIDTLRLISNTIKHGEGRSAAELKKLKPNYFRYGKAELTTGKDLEIPLKDFIYYVEKSKDFWKELGAEITKS